MNKNSLSKRIISSILALVMILGAFTAFDGIFSGVKAETVNADGSITYGASDSAIVMNKDAWLEPDGTYAIDLTAYVTGQKTIESQEFDAPTDFIIVVEQNCFMVDYYCYNDCYNYMSMTTYKLAAAKSVARALVDELRGGAAGGVDHRVGIIGYGGYSCYTNSNSNTGLFDNTGHWYNYRFNFGAQYSVPAQSKYDSTLVHVNTNEGYNILKNDIEKFNVMAASLGGYTDAGLTMAKGVINATKNDSYQAVDVNGNITNVPRKKVVILISDGTPGYEGFDMSIGAAAVNVATDIKHNFDAKIFTITLSTELEEQITAYDWRGTLFSNNPDSFHADAVPINKRAYNPQYGKGAWNMYNSTIYSTLKFNNEEFFTRDFTAIISSAYPCTDNYGANGPITAKYMTNHEAYNYVGQGTSGVYSSNGFPLHYRSGRYATYVSRNKSIAYFYTEANGSNKLITGLYDNNVRTFNNRIPYNNHPVDRIADSTYGKYYIKVNEPSSLVNGTYNNPNYNVPTTAMRAIISKIVSEIPEGTSYTGSTNMANIGEAFIKDIISDYFFYHDSFDPAVNVKTFTQDAVGYQNGEYVFAKSIVPYSGAIVKQYDDVVTVAGFDYDANTCYRDANGVHGKKFIVQIRGLLAKPETVGEHLSIANTPGNLSGLYSGTSSDNSGNGGGSNNGSISPITSIDLQPITVIGTNYPKPAVLKVNPANADYTVTWYVSNSNMAYVDGNGNIKAKTSSGSTTLNVIVTDKLTGAEYTDSANVTIINSNSSSAITSIDLQPMTVAKGSSKTSNLTVNPSNAHFNVASWTSSNSSVAKVDFTTGKVTGVSEGTAIITAWLYDYNTKTYSEVTAPVTVVDGSTSGGTNPNPNPNPNPGADKIIVHDGDEAIFPIPYVDIREKSIVYDFSLKIQDDNALIFFETDAYNHDVRHVLTIDDAYIQQPKLANGSYGYHGTYPYAGNAKYDAYKDHFEVGIANVGANGAHNHSENNCHAYVVIKSMNGERYDVASILELTSTRRDIITGEMKTVYEWCRVYFLPATNVHFEESLFTYTNSGSNNTGVGAWSVDGTANGPAYNATTGRLLEGTKYTDAHQATANKLYGHDAEYHNLFEANKVRDTHGDSNGRAMTVTVNTELRTLVGEKQAQWPTVEFTFRGNAIDLISRAGINTGVFGVDIVPVDKDYSYVGTAADSAHLIVNTYFSEGIAYQSTIMNYSGLNWGEYKVQIRAIYVPAFDMQSNPNYVPTKGDDMFLGLEQGVTYQLVNACTNPGSSKGEPTKGHGSFDCYIDAVRIYNPLVDHINANDVEKHEYYAADEHNPEYSSIRERLINAASFGGAADRVSGIVYIDTNNGNPVTVTDYDRFGPNHEAYLTPGNGFAFTVTEFNKKTDRLHISAKSPNAKNVIMSVNGVKYTIDSATELFFDITDAVTETGRVVITCDDMGGSPDAILSLCQVKLVANAKTRNGDRFYVDTATLQYADEISGVEYTTLLAPRNVKSVIADRMPSISWDEVQGAARYQVWRMPVGGSFELAATVTGTTFIDESDLTVGTKYYYKVRALDQYNTTNAFSGAVSITVPSLTAPKSLKVKVTNRQPVISWNAAPYAASYEIWRMAEGGEFELIATVPELNYTDASGISGGTAYSYKIRTVDARGYVSEFTTAVSASIPVVAAPTGLKAKLTNRQPVISWKKAAYAVSYEVWRMTNGGEYVLVATTSALKFTDASALAGGLNCSYKVRAIDENGAKSVFSADITVTIPVLTAPASFAAKISSRKPVISWKKVSGAVGYQVWRMEEGGEFELIDTVNTAKFVDNGVLGGGKAYTYKVRAIDAHNLTGSFTEGKTVVFPNLAAPTKVKATVSNGAPVVTFKAVSYATGYAVYRSTSATEGFEFAGVVNEASFTDDAGELTHGVRYYYKVVALDDLGNVSEFSAVVSAVIPE